MNQIRIESPDSDERTGCERVLRSLPAWFGIESALMEYVEDTAHLPTFVLRQGEELAGFISLCQHFPRAWEVHCIALHAEVRGKGLGAQLLGHAEKWMAAQGAKLIQVKTIAEANPSPAYMQTRAFYTRMGYMPFQVFPELWSKSNPCLQMLKIIDREFQ